MVPKMAGIVSAIVYVLWAAAPAAAETATRGDLREFRVGMAVAALPTTGYANFACGADSDEPGRTLAGWADFATCPAGPDGLHEVRFEYGPTKVAFAEANDKWEGTKVAGHPVVVSLLVSETAVVEGIRIATDPSARRYMRKKAYLLSLQVKYRYSPDTWSCVRHDPSDGEMPLGGVYIKERCENRLPARRVRLETDLYRKPGLGPGEIVNATRVEIKTP